MMLDERRRTNGSATSRDSVPSLVSPLTSERSSFIGSVDSLSLFQSSDNLARAGQVDEASVNDIDWSAFLVDDLSWANENVGAGSGGTASSNMLPPVEENHVAESAVDSQTHQIGPTLPEAEHVVAEATDVRQGGGTAPSAEPLARHVDPYNGRLLARAGSWSYGQPSLVIAGGSAGGATHLANNRKARRQASKSASVGPIRNKTSRRSSAHNLTRKTSNIGI